MLKKRKLSKPDERPQDDGYVVPDHAKPLNFPKIKDKTRRAATFAKLKRQREKQRAKFRKAQLQAAEAAGTEVKITRPQRTLDNMRTPDVTMVTHEDQEVFEDEENDEFAQYFNSTVTPKVIITTAQSPTPGLIHFVKEMLGVFPNSEFRPRKAFALKDICKWATGRGYTDVLVFEETALAKRNRRSALDSLIHVHLPMGPTAYYRVTNVRMPKSIKNHAKATDHYPELVLNRFDTRLGRTVGRMMTALFPQNPEFLGRRVVTFHNQRDFVFFRHHRYIFESREKVRLQEMGPRFTLKLQKLQHGAFDPRYGEYEWVQKKELIPDRRTFVL